MSNPLKQRANLTIIANETLAILADGSYRLPNKKLVSLVPALLEAIANSRLYRPHEFPAELVSAPLFAQTQIEVTTETTLAAAARLLKDDPSNEPFCLNFASAKNPGGGFQTGAQAQESLARASGLYPTLTRHMEMYEFNRQLQTCLYSDHMIYSPGVPVFRNDQGALLEAPWQATFLTSPAVNVGAMRRNELTRLPLVEATMKYRLQRLLWIAYQHGHSRLVLGAWGCGVFGNDPFEIAELFANELTGTGMFGNCFQQIVFAIYDRTNNQAVFAPFQKRLTAQTHL